MRVFLIPAAALILGAGLFAAPEAQARFSPQQVEAPSLVDNVACVTRRIRTVRPNGRVVYRTVRECNAARPVRRVERCRTVRERIVRPNGNVVYRDVRRCR
jgi:hypothetical protein